MNASPCPYCGAETRPGDNFCLNCGNRLLPATPSSQQAQPVIGGDSTIPAQEGWAQSFQSPNSAPSSSGSSWPDVNARTLAAGDEDAPTIRGEAPTAIPSSTAQATMERPARFVLRAENGDVLAEYPLEKPEISIGRAPNSDILLSKDKLTSRRHATVRYENNTYVLYDERSANGTFVNGQQLEELTPHTLQDGDHIGIGEHELVFHGPSSTPASSDADVADLPTIAVQYNPSEMTYRTREDELVTSATSDDFSTRSMENGATASSASAAPQMDEVPSTPPVMSTPSMSSAPTETGAPPMPSSNEPAASMPSTYASAKESAAPSAPSAYAFANGQPASPSASAIPPSSPSASTGVNFKRFTAIPQPTVPDIAPLLAALSSLDGQVMSLQEQLNATQEAVRNHDAEVAQIANQLRAGIRRVSERMDNTIADVARSREALAWADLLQLVDDVQNNPRDIEYVSKLGRKARELNKIFQIHQSVLSTLAECNSLLRGLVGEEK